MRGTFSTMTLAAVAVSWPVAVAAQGSPAPGPAVERGVAYVQDGTPEQVLDLYTPGGSGYATVVFIHGGSLKESGERRGSPIYARVCEPFVAAGVACATIDYRLAPSHAWPAMPDDAAAAFRWVRQHIADRGGDPARVFLFGHSSGCELAAVLGSNPKFLGRAGLAPGDVAGVVAMGCILTPLAPHFRRAAEQGLGLEEMKRRWQERGKDDVYRTFEDLLDSDPSRFVGAHVPPTLIVIAEEERFRPPILEQAARFVDLMYEARRPADIVIVPGTHKSSILSVPEPGDPAFAAIRRFIAAPADAGGRSRPWH